MRAERIQELRDRIAINYAGYSSDCASIDVAECLDAIEQLQAEIERLRAALQHIDDGSECEADQCWDGARCHACRVSDIARRALKGDDRG